MPLFRPHSTKIRITRRTHSRQSALWKSLRQAGGEADAPGRSFIVRWEPLAWLLRGVFILLLFVPERCFFQAAARELTFCGADTVKADTLSAVVPGISVPADSALLPLDSVAVDADSGLSTGDSTIQNGGRPPDSARPFEYRQMENRAFHVGEHLEFEIAFGIIKAGTATMSIPSMETVRGRPCYRILTTAQSNSFFSRLYKVRDWVESILDARGLFSWKFRKHLREGRYKADRSAEFDPVRGRVITPKDTLPSPPYVLDVLASFYYARTRPLETGSSFDMDSFSDNKIYPLRVLVHGRERIKVPAGQFDCVVVEPVLRGEGLFKQKGKLTIWVTDDERRMPVLMKSKILVGSIDARLTAFRFE
ncbi:DUF3108 domain-containing protein [bacterium]|nr:DUF3108 domain-containing protein [bacterium]